MTEFVVGTGGKNHYGFVAAPLAGEVVRNDTSFGVIQMTLRPTSYSWKFVPAPGLQLHRLGLRELRPVSGLRAGVTVRLRLEARPDRLRGPEGA